MIEKNNGFHIFFKYQFCLIKNKFNMFDKNNHHKVLIFQQIKIFNHKKTLWFNDDLMCTYVLLIFATYIFLFFSNWWFNQNKICFFAIKCLCQWWHKCVIEIFKFFKINHFININEKIVKFQNTLIHHEIINCALCFF